jgi:hypothetical protein
MQNQIELTEMTYKLVPPNNHCRNLAKKAIQTFKGHMVSVLSGCLPTMPMHLWCQLLPQIECQFLLLCQSKANPNILAYAHAYGYHNYNHHPFVPIDVEALVHNQHHKCRLFSQHCRKAFVLGTSTKHYQCWKFWSVTMHATYILDAAFFKHKYLKNPMVTPEDRVIAAAGVLPQALDNQMPPHMRKSTIQALSNLQDVFQQAAINYNTDPTTHVIQAAPPRVPLDARPKLASPATPKRVGTIKPSPPPSRLLSTGTVSDPRVRDTPQHLLCQLNWISWKILFPHNVSHHDKSHGQTHLRFDALLMTTPLRATHEVAHRSSQSLSRPS